MQKTLFNSPERLTPRLAPRRQRSQFLNAFIQLLGDRWLIGFLVFAFLCNVALWIFLAIRFEDLNELLPLHFDSQGLADRIESKDGIFALPLGGLIVVFANAGIALLANARERAAGILVAFSAFLVEILLWLAALNIVGGFA